ncbi:amidohydrolase family protein [Enterovirga sp. CN4-39]|uniref:amidohydrolase family protein n=1 Tax=Enterovirga sp. CN4-39 TaxID=3400910 RepID=UPI003C03BAAE
MNAPITCFRAADWLVAWDEGAGRHRYVRGGDLAFQGDTVIHASAARFEGRCDEEIDAGGMCLLPGLVNIHTHTGSMPTFRGVREDLGNPNFYFSGLYEGWGLFMPPIERRSVCCTVAISEMLLSGVTTYVDMSYPFPGWVETVARSGIRSFVSPLFDSARVVAESDHAVRYEWSDDGGEGAYRRALDVLEVVESDRSGLLSPMMSPMAVDTVSPDLLRQSHAVAQERGWPYHLHAGMAVLEFQEMTRGTGQTPIQWLAKLGVLGPGTIIGHAIFLDHHSWLHWHTRSDLGILAESGSSVSHCPVVFARYGVLLESLGSYRRAGITVGIGTDTHPHNMLEEIRIAATNARIADEHMFSVTTADAFDAATIGGAEALGRRDIGRLAPGAKADILVADATHPMMLPLYDPIRSLVYSAADRAVKDIYVGGRRVVENGRVLTLDHAEAVRQLHEIQSEVTASMPGRDRKGRRADEVAPRVYEGA